MIGYAVLFKKDGDYYLNDEKIEIGKIIHLQNNEKLKVYESVDDCFITNNYDSTIASVNYYDNEIEILSILDGYQVVGKCESISNLLGLFLKSNCKTGAFLKLKSKLGNYLWEIYPEYRHEFRDYIKDEDEIYVYAVKYGDLKLVETKITEQYFMYLYAKNYPESRYSLINKIDIGFYATKWILEFEEDYYKMLPHIKKYDDIVRVLRKYNKDSFANYFYLNSDDDIKLKLLIDFPDLLKQYGFIDKFKLHFKSFFG